MTQSKLNYKRVWIDTLAKKYCPNCKRAGTVGTVRSCFEYMNGKRRNATHFCDNCAVPEIEPMLLRFVRNNNRPVEFVRYDGRPLGTILLDMQARLLAEYENNRKPRAILTTTLRHR